MTFLVGAPKEILNPYDWMPSHGESGVRFWSEGVDVVLEVKYESDEDSESLLKRHIRFVGVSYFCKSAFPSPAGLINIRYESKWPIGSLIEFENSQVADAWAGHLATTLRPRHFLIQFTSENFQFHVVAKDYALSDEEEVSQ